MSPTSKKIISLVTPYLTNFTPKRKFGATKFFINLNDIPTIKSMNSQKPAVKVKPLQLNDLILPKFIKLNEEKRAKSVQSEKRI